MSNSRLIFDERRSDRPEQLGDQIIFFVVERGAAERGDRGRSGNAPAVVVELAEGPIARVLDAFANAVHRPLIRYVLPLRRERRATFGRRPTTRIDVELIGRGTFGAERARVDRRIGIAFDVEDL